MNKFDLIAIIFNSNKMQGFSFYIKANKFVEYDFKTNRLAIDEFTEKDNKTLKNDKKDIIYNELFLILK